MIAASWLTGCETVSAEHVVGACPPLVEYSREVQNRAATDLGALPDGSKVVEMMGDYEAMREQSRACS